MPGAEERRQEALEWLAKVEEDLLVATHTLTLGERCPTAAVCYHVQQCVEKDIKAVLIDHGIVFPFTHDIRRVHALVPAAERFALSAADEDGLVAYVTSTRYPGDPAPSRPDAEAAVALARRVRDDLAQRLGAAA